jgi:hypothetical protein
MSESKKKSTPSEPAISNNGAGFSGSDPIAKGTEPKPIIEVPDSDDIFSHLEDLRIGQDFQSQLGLDPVRTHVPVTKPEPTWFFRTSPILRLNTCLLNVKNLGKDNGIYLINPDLWKQLAPELKPFEMVGCMSRSGVFFIWPIRLPGADDLKINPWHRSAITASNMAKTSWIRMVADMNLGAYTITVARAALDEPKWPDEDFGSLLRIAFQDSYVESADHILLRKLRGDL